MKIDICKLYQPTDRKTISISLNYDLVKEMGFIPNTYVQVIYEQGKISLVEKIEEIK